MKPLVTATNIHKAFSNPVLTGFDLTLYPGERVALVGESGCGKTTIARILAGLLTPDCGEIDWQDPKPTVQMVFQDAHSSFNPKLKLGTSLLEPMANLKIPRAEAVSRMEELLTQCGLDATMMDRYPHQLSGGQCQRAALARALSTYPQLVICDEVTSALDQDTATQILELLSNLQQSHNLTYLVITHDQALAQEFCTRIIPL